MNSLALEGAPMLNESARTRRTFAAGLKVAMAFILVLGAAATASAQIIYNSIPSPLPGNVASFGPEAYAFREFGDGLVFAGTQRTLATITVIMSDFACTNGHWFNQVGTNGACVTNPVGSTFKQPITINIYDNTGTILLHTKTATFDIPYRPSSDAAKCAKGSPLGGDGTQWYSLTDNACYHGLATAITFDFTGSGIVLPNQVIVTVAFNTTSAGPAPLGAQPCNTSSGGCPYDSLNISAQGSPTTGSNTDPNGFYLNSYTASSQMACSNPNPTGVLFDATPCHTKDHPEILVDTTPTDALQVSYAANLSVGDSFVDLTNTGADAVDSCANIYVFDPAEEMISCCACPLTPNGLRSFNVNTDLVSNLLTPGKPDSVSIVVTGSVTIPCDAAAAVNYYSGLRLWSTTIHKAPSGAYQDTETKFQIVPPSASQLAELTATCGFIQADGSAFGICKSCRTGALGANQR